MEFFKKILFSCAFLAICSGAFSQQAQAVKVHDIFLEFLKRKMSFSPQESSRMRPLVIKYFNETRKINKEFTDPLDREQHKIALKIRYRNQFIPIIGTDRSNRFFSEEQLFRRKVREELRQRKKG